MARGVGNGHGRGLSQWGAFGRAVNGGQSWQQILDAYYGGTVNGNRSDGAFRVRLMDWNDVATFGVISAPGPAGHGLAAVFTGTATATAPDDDSFNVETLTLDARLKT